MTTCYQCYDDEGELIDGLCVNCYSNRQEQIFRQLLGDEIIEQWRKEDEATNPFKEPS